MLARLSCLLLGLLLWPAVVVHAAEEAPSPWSEGVTSWQGEGFYYWSYDGNVPRVRGAALRFSYAPRDRLNVSAGLGGWDIDTRESRHLSAIHVELGVDWQMLRRTRWALQLTGRLGLFHAEDDVPDDGSTFNFTERLGVQASYCMTPRLHLFARHDLLHASNGSIFPENPGTTGSALVVGVIVVHSP